MQSLRAFLLRHRALAALLVLAALCLKAAVPQGYMIGNESRVVTIKICNDGLGAHAASQIVIPIEGAAGGSAQKHDKTDTTCAYSALSFAALGGTDPALLALALLFILALAFAPAPAPPIRRVAHLRPHLRGPPALI